MDYEYGGEYCRRGHVPAFGSWEWNDAVPFTQCFDTATTTQQHPPPSAFLHHYPQDRDLYIAGDLYDNHHLVAPAVILLPRRRAKVGQEPTKKHNFKTDAPTPAVRRRKTTTTAAPKPVDEDLYKVSPRLLSVKSERRKGGGFGCISRCFFPTQA